MQSRTEHMTNAECRQTLEDLYSGASVVLPSSEEHARHMLLVAQVYIDQRVQKTFDAVTK